MDVKSVAFLRSASIPSRPSRSRYARTKSERTVEAKPSMSSSATGTSMMQMYRQICRYSRFWSSSSSFVGTPSGPSGTRKASQPKTDATMAATPQPSTAIVARKRGPGGIPAPH